jgi:uncharacterized oxidoreductase
MFHLNDKSIVITGGTAGIGLALVSAMHPQNHLIIIGRNKQKLAALAAKFPGIHTVLADLSKPAEAEKAGLHIAETHSKIDVLINNAATQSETHFTAATFCRQSINDEINTNLTSLCLLTQILLPALMSVPNAVILNVNSALGVTPKKSSAVYCATKGALHIFTRSLRYQLENSGVAVQQAFMPLVDTDMTAGRGAGKMNTETAARHILHGIKHGVKDHAIGKVKLLMLIHRFMPSLSYKILKEA